MNWHKLSGSIRVGNQEIITTLSTMIHKSGYFYARSEAQNGISQIKIFVYPFTPQMVTRESIVPGVPTIYELGGTDIGHVRCGSDNADGAWRTWSLRSVTIAVVHYRNGANIKFKVLCNRGAWTSMGSVDPTTEGTVEPFDYEFEVFAEIEDLATFLVTEHEDWIEPTAFIKKFIERLKNTNDLSFETKKP